MVYVRRSLLWLLGTILITPFAWSTTASLLRYLLVPMPEDTVFLFLASALLGSMWGAVVAVAFALPYGLFLVAWPWLVRALPIVERTRLGLTIAAATLALPAALFVGLETGRFAGTIRPREFTEAFVAAFVGGWVGLLLPRLTLKSLSPGRLIASPTRAAV
jgi:hypothetical protein